MTKSLKDMFDPSRPLAHMGRHVGVATLVLLAVVGYYIWHYSIGERVIEVFLGIPLVLVIAMVGLQGLYIVLQGFFLRSLYGVVGHQKKWPYLSTMYLSMNVINTLAPVVGLSGCIYMMYFEHQRGMGRAQGFLINFLYFLIDYLVFLVILLVGLSLLYQWGEVTQSIILTSLVFTVFVLGFFLVGLFFFSHATALPKLMRWVGGLLNRVRRQSEPVFSDEKITSFTLQVKEGWKESCQNVGSLLKASMMALLLHACLVTILWLAFQAVQVAPGVHLLVAGYTVATLLHIVSITPGGIGFAEGGMTAVFVALGVPVEQALVIALIYRTITIGLLLALGIPSLHLLPRLSRKPA